MDSGFFGVRNFGAREGFWKQGFLGYGTTGLGAEDQDRDWGLGTGELMMRQKIPGAALSERPTSFSHILIVPTRFIYF